MCLQGKLPRRQCPSKELRALLTKQACPMGHLHKGVVADPGGHEVDREAPPCSVLRHNSIP